MKKLKVLNLYSGIGGNRKLWENVDVTAVEFNEDIANVYKDYFPNDNVIIDDAHKFLLEHYQEFDFIWSSPPCQSHSVARHAGLKTKLTSEYRYSPVYPDMKLYEEILLLKHHFDGMWIVENVVPYYKPLIPTKTIQNHLFWSNFHIRGTKVEPRNIENYNTQQGQKLTGFDLSKYKLKNKKQILRNCVNSELGNHILKSALCDKNKGFNLT